MTSTATSSSDEELALSAREGDRDALEMLLRRHYASLRAVCHRIVIDSGNAEDAMQNAAISIARGIRRFDGHSSIKTWMHRVAVNASLDEIRRARRRPQLVAIHALESAEGAANIAHDVTTQLLVRDALLSMEPEFRAVLVLRHIAELEYDDIARELDIPVGTVKSRISRGRQQLAAIIGNNDVASERQTTSVQGDDRGDT